MMTCEEVRLSLGAHALGALEPEEALEVDTHLADCEVCGAELLELSGVSAFLAKVSARDVELVASPPREVLDRLLSARVKRHRRGRLLLAVAASVAVLAVGGTVWTTTQQGGESTAASAPQERGAAHDSALKDRGAVPDPTLKEPPSVLAETAGPQLKADMAPDLLFEGSAGGIKASVRAVPGYRQALLTVQVTGVAVGTPCRLVAVGAGDRRETTSEWTVDSASYERDVAFPGNTSIPVTEIRYFEIVDSSGEVLVRVKRAVR